MSLPNVYNLSTTSYIKANIVFYLGILTEDIHGFQHPLIFDVEFYSYFISIQIPMAEVSNRKFPSYDDITCN